MWSVLLGGLNIALWPRLWPNLELKKLNYKPADFYRRTTWGGPCLSVILPQEVESRLFNQKLQQTMDSGR